MRARTSGAARLAQTLAVALLVLAAACTDLSTPTGGRVLVVTTTTQIRSMAEAVAGDQAEVRSILGPGVDPHTFEPRPSDVVALSQSALVLKNGAGLDDWLDKLVAGAGGNHPLITVSTGVPLLQGDAEEPAGDPHIWFSVLNAMTMTNNIRDGLMRADPPHAAQYQANAVTYVDELRTLDRYIADQVATVPTEQRKLVTNHDVFGYYAARYGLTLVGSIIPSLNSAAQPSAQDVANLVQKIRSQHVRAIFLESSINPQLAEQVARESGVQVVAGQLYGDTLGPAGSPGASYTGMMRYNTDTIVSALK